MYAFILLSSLQNKVSITVEANDELRTQNDRIAITHN